MGQKIVIDKIFYGPRPVLSLLIPERRGMILRWVRAGSACFAPFCWRRCAGRKPFPPDSPQATGQRRMVGSRAGRASSPVTAS